MQKIAINKIRPNPDQPRKKFDAEELQRLAASIKAAGLLQPITVRPIGKGLFEIVAGERRWRACKLLNARTIDCEIRTMSDLTRDIGAIVENLQRQDITPLEEADAFNHLQAAGLTPQQIAEKTGASILRVQWRLKLLNLEPNIRRLFENEQLDRQQAMEIARLDQHRDQVKVLQLINRGQLVGWKAVRNAVDMILDEKSQSDIFGDSPVTPEEVKIVRSMEQRIDEACRLVAAGWKKGECVIANRVNPDRARLIADKLNALQTCARVMERELRNISAQAIISA
jgi:ParB family chromosome partitioning protein